MGVFTQDTREDVLEFVKKHKITFPTGLDPGEIADRFKLTAHPIAFYINADGEIVDSRIGGTDEKQLEKDFERLFF